MDEACVAGDVLNNGHKQWQAAGSSSRYVGAPLGLVPLDRVSKSIRCCAAAPSWTDSRVEEVYWLTGGTRRHAPQPPPHLA